MSDLPKNNLLEEFAVGDYVYWSYDKIKLTEGKQALWRYHDEMEAYPLPMKIEGFTYEEFFQEWMGWYEDPEHGVSLLFLDEMEKVSPNFIPMRIECQN